MPWLRAFLFSQALAPWVKSTRLQSVWTRLYHLCLYGMNYGGGGDLRKSGEEWFLRSILAPRCAGVPNPIVIDVGANVGDYACLASAVIPNATVFALEPAADVHEYLVSRLRSQGRLEKVRPFRLGLSDRVGPRELHIYSFQGRWAPALSSVVDHPPSLEKDTLPMRTEVVPFCTLDQFVRDIGIGRVDLLKIDVEGHELAVLEGSRGLLLDRRIQAIQFEIGRRTMYARCRFFDFWELLTSDFRIYRVLPDGLREIPEYREDVEIFMCTNYVAIRRD